MGFWSGCPRLSALQEHKKRQTGGELVVDGPAALHALYKRMLSKGAEWKSVAAWLEVQHGWLRKVYTGFTLQIFSETRL